MTRRAVVVGAGVSGLSCAVRLAEAGCAVEVWARERPAATTSAVAAAIWFPYAAGPPQHVARWAAATLAELQQAAAAGAPGVRLQRGIWLAADPAADEAPCLLVPGARSLAPRELPAGFAKGYALTLPVCEMPTYLAALQRRLHAAGGIERARTVDRLDDACAAGADVVVNCAGLGARELAGDSGVYPIRGQVVRTARGGCDRFVIADDAPGGMAYVIPRHGLGDCVLGGTAEVGVADIRADDVEADAIVCRCTALSPELGGAERLAVAVGLRPGRAAVRLEREVRAGGVVVHDYGHGGSGLTLSWGCADDVLRLALTG